jgi:hypothetical protein
MKSIPVTMVALVAASFALSSCKNTINTPLGDIVFPADSISYSRQVQPLFNVGCNYSGCHDDQTRAGNLSLTNYIDATTDQPGVVIAGNPSGSILIQRIKGTGPIMPPLPYSPLSQNQIQGLTTWIKEGAHLN